MGLYVLTSKLLKVIYLDILKIIFNNRRNQPGVYKLAYSIAAFEVILGLINDIKFDIFHHFKNVITILDKDFIT